jgi:hypothetical protein
MSEFYWAKKVGTTPTDLQFKKEKVREITEKVIRKSKLTRLIDTMVLSPQVDKGNLPSNILSIHTDRFFSGYQEFGAINLYLNHIDVSKEKYLEEANKLATKLKSELNQEWTYSLTPNIEDALTPLVYPAGKHSIRPRMPNI